VKRAKWLITRKQLKQAKRYFLESMDVYVLTKKKEAAK
jgi:hypothetical protein